MRDPPTTKGTGPAAPRKHTRAVTGGERFVPPTTGSPWVQLRLERLVEHDRCGWDGTRVMNEQIIANLSSHRGQRDGAGQVAGRAAHSD
jgi:hypothetical protein